MDMTQNKCCRRGANLRRRRRRRRKILRSIIFSCSIIAVAVFVAVGSSMIRSGDGRTNKYDVEAGNNTYDNAVIENSKISGKNKIQNNQSMLDDIIHFLRREMLDFTAFPVFFVSNLLLVQRKKYYFNRATVSRNCSIVCIRQITRLPKKVSPPDRGGES